MRFLLGLAYAYLFYTVTRAVLRAVLRWLAGPSAPATKADGGEMVKDPRCGIFVLKSSAVGRRVGGELRYFCGEECAAAFSADNGG